MWATLLGLITNTNFTKIFSFIKAHWKYCAIAILVILLAWNIRAKNALERKYSATLELKSGETAAAELDRGNLTVGGNTSGDSDTGYVPPESTLRASIIKNKQLQKKLDALNARIDQLEKDGTLSAEDLAALKKERDKLASDVHELRIDYDKYNVCLRPGFGIMYTYNKGWLAEIDVKVAYYGRWSLMVGVTKEGFGAAISRHLDDLLPFKPRNVEAQLFIGRLYKENKLLGGIGLRSNF